MGLHDVAADGQSEAAAAGRALLIDAELFGYDRDACIRKTLAETDGDKDEAARRLGISRATLYRELRPSPALF